ncbi:MAG TPA: helix-turn-helix domain-containing protein [Gemmatimonadaceae bacterium]
MPAEPLRTRQAAVARNAILNALLRHLEAGDADDVAMEDLAREAGVSRRTLYRYFPSRSHLLDAAGDWIRAEVLQLPIEIGPEGVAASFRAAAARLQRRPRLARALLRSETGRAVRSGYREERVKAIRRAIRAEAPGASRRELERAAAVVAHLCSSTAWTTIQDDTGLDASGAQAAVAWAIETLLARLREGNDATRKGGAR